MDRRRLGDSKLAGRPGKLVGRPGTRAADTRSPAEGRPGTPVDRRSPGHNLEQVRPDSTPADRLPLAVSIQTARGPGLLLGGNRRAAPEARSRQVQEDIPIQGIPIQGIPQGQHCSVRSFFSET